MIIKNILNASKIKSENEQLKQLLTPEMQDVLTLSAKIMDLNQTLESLEKDIDQKLSVVKDLDNKLNKKKQMLITFDDDILVQDFGLYQPRYAYATSDEYKEQLSSIREEQKSCIKSNRAVTGNFNFVYNNSKVQGNKMVRDMQKLLLRAFNSECDEVIGKIKYNNFYMSLKKITSSADAVSKLGKMLSISVTNEYFNLKKEELSLALEYQQKKQNEKEDLKQARTQMREQVKLQKELGEQRKKFQKEKSHYHQALISILSQIESPGDISTSILLEKKAELEHQLEEIDISLKDLDYREANQKAGYVYVISNVGSFGENIFKIGMTRRLIPQERIDELGDASVPFNFDVHAMIFSDDAPALETALHKAFEEKKINTVNTRREFFKVSLDEIKEVIKNNFDKTVEFIDFPDAEQYRISLKMKQAGEC